MWLKQDSITDRQIQDKSALHEDCHFYFTRLNFWLFFSNGHTGVTRVQNHRDNYQGRKSANWMVSIF